MRRVVATTFLALALGVASPSSASAHPLHTTLTELSEDRAHGVVRATIRIFADDFGKAVARAMRGGAFTTAAASDAAALAYLSSVFRFNRGGHALAMRSCGTRRTGDLLWICVETMSASGLAGLEVRNTILTDLYDDQVNVVQGVIGGARRSLLFTKGDAAKAIS